MFTMCNVTSFRWKHETIPKALEIIDYLCLVRNSEFILIYINNKCDSSNSSITPDLRCNHCYPKMVVLITVGQA